MSFLHALTGLPWDWVGFGGALGGAVNAAISSNLKPLPAWSPPTTGAGTRRVTRIGLLLSATSGAASSIGLLWGLHGIANFGAIDSTAQQMRLMMASVFLGFITVRGLTSEVEKVLLRLAVRSAATAPAAHPEIAQAIEHAPAYAVYEIASELAPRQRPSPLERLRVASAFEPPHPQRL